MKLIAVYGSLRKGLINYENYLSSATFVGEFNSEPIFSLYPLCGGIYPGLKLNGNTSVVMEVYSVSEIEEHKIDCLEGYNKLNTSNEFYNKLEINTPYGEASVYIYVPSLYTDKITHGDWKKYKEEQYIKLN